MVSSTPAAAPAQSGWAGRACDPSAGLAQQGNGQTFAFHARNQSVQQDSNSLALTGWGGLQGDLHIAHCWGFHSGLVRLVTAFYVLAKLLHHPIRWDSETIGCEPSLSSIPAAEQRTLLTALQEVAHWLALPQNKQEFLIVFFDDQMDLAAWVSCAADVVTCCCTLCRICKIRQWLFLTLQLHPGMSPCAAINHQLLEEGVRLTAGHCTQCYWTPCLQLQLSLLQRKVALLLGLYWFQESS